MSWSSQRSHHWSENRSPQLCGDVSKGVAARHHDAGLRPVSIFIEVSSRLVLTGHVWSELYKLIWVEVPAALSGDDFSSQQRGCPCQRLLREHWSGGMQITNLWISVCLMRKPCQLVLTSWPLKTIHLNEWAHSLGLRVGLYVGAWPIADTSHTPNTDQVKGRQMTFRLAEMVLEEYRQMVVGKTHEPRVGVRSFFPPVRSSCRW